MQCKYILNEPGQGLIAKMKVFCDEIAVERDSFDRTNIKITMTDCAALFLELYKEMIDPRSKVTISTSTVEVVGDEETEETITDYTCETEGFDEVCFFAVVANFPQLLIILESTIEVLSEDYHVRHKLMTSDSSLVLGESMLQDIFDIFENFFLSKPENLLKIQSYNFLMFDSFFSRWAAFHLAACFMDKTLYVDYVLGIAALRWPPKSFNTLARQLRTTLGLEATRGTLAFYQLFEGVNAPPRANGSRTNFFVSNSIGEIAIKSSEEQYSYDICHDEATLRRIMRTIIKKTLTHPAGRSYTTGELASMVGSVRLFNTTQSGNVNTKVRGSLLGFAS